MLTTDLSEPLVGQIQEIVSVDSGGGAVAQARLETPAVGGVEDMTVGDDGADAFAGVQARAGVNQVNIVDI